MKPCNTCGSQDRYADGSCRPCQQLRSRNRCREYRARVLDMLGPVCVKCGFIDPRALQINHINGGGDRERKRRGGTGYYRAMLSDPDSYQILCANCNWIKKYENSEHAGYLA